MSKLAHVLVCGGVTEEWKMTTALAWQSQLETLANAVRGTGVRWLTICPFSGVLSLEDRDQIFQSVIAACGGDLHHDRVSYISGEGLLVTVDPCADGRQRIVAAVGRLQHSHEFDEAMLGASVLSPSQEDPDLVVVLGRPNQLPTSLVWELAYSELVFLDIPWMKCNVEHLQMAIDDFQRRDRRFGSIDS
ncbi:MAG: undecaprenyl diphosphate synthase family protein [Ilumatobacteraceae bacterium]